MCVRIIEVPQVSYCVRLSRRLMTDRIPHDTMQVVEYSLRVQLAECHLESFVMCWK